MRPWDTCVALVEMILAHVEPDGQPIIDIGAHSGALLLRLQTPAFPI